MLCVRLTIIAFLVVAWSGTSMMEHKTWKSSWRFRKSADDADVRYDVVCDDTNNELQCPEGHVIELVEIGYGIKDPAVCADRTRPGPLSETDCLDSSIKNWIKMTCNGLNRCRVSDYSWIDMVSCNWDHEFFMQLGYRCLKQDEDVNTVVVCEKEHIKCDKGLIQIKVAKFGRVDENACTDTPSDMTACVSREAEEVVKKRCNNQSECSLEVTQDLGWPFMCDHNPFYLTVSYACE